MGFFHVVSPIIPDRITDDPAQKGQELLIWGLLLSDRAPKLSATVQHPRISCNNPSDSSGLPGRSSPAPARRLLDMGGGGGHRLRAAEHLGGAPRHLRARCWEGSPPGEETGAVLPMEEDSPAMGQQEPGSSTGRDITGVGILAVAEQRGG